MAKRECYSHKIADMRKAEKRKEAENRQKERAKRTDKQQIDKLNAEGWAAKKERARLNKRIK